MYLPPFDLKGKIAVVSGSTRGICTSRAKRHFNLTESGRIAINASRS